MEAPNPLKKFLEEHHTTLREMAARVSRVRGWHCSPVQIHRWAHGSISEAGKAQLAQATDGMVPISAWPPKPPKAVRP